MMQDAATAIAEKAQGPIEVERVRADFPILARTVHGQPLVYLDTAASAHKPRAVIEAMSAAYERSYANVHRGLHQLSCEATDAYERSRSAVARFLNAATADQIVFTRNATEAINLVANSYGTTALQPGDEVVLTELEHHANIVPWQLLRERRGIVLRIAPIEDDGSLSVERFSEVLGPRTRFVAFTHCSNVLGCFTEAEAITRRAHDAGARVLVDGAQAVVHAGVDVQALDADFYVFSGHKLYGPTGIGVLYGKAELLAEMPPYQGGGEMIEAVTFARTTFKSPPHRFEAGTPPIVEAIGLARAIRYLEALGAGPIAAHESQVVAAAVERLSEIADLRIFRPATGKAPIISFAIAGAHPFDLAALLDQKGVAVRAGHLCAQPLLRRLGITGVVRASFGVYTTEAEIDALVSGLRQARAELL
jgi:cysteine desulfurase/selenocysteine lyase